MRSCTSGKRAAQPHFAAACCGGFFLEAHAAGLSSKRTKKLNVSERLALPGKLAPLGPVRGLSSVGFPTCSPATAMSDSRHALEQTHYDALLVGTDLTTTILGAALVHAGFQVLHVDTNDYYGSDWASLTLGEMAQWCAKRNALQDKTQHVSLSFPYFAETSASLDASSEPSLPEALRRQDRHFSLSLTPTLLASRGHAIETLVRSNVAQYSTFRLLELTALALESTGGSGGAMRRVPCSKEDVFKDRSLSLIEKRKLMKFLQHVSHLASHVEGGKDQIGDADGDLVLDQPFDTYLRTQFGFPESLIAALVYGIALAPWRGHGTTKEGCSAPSLSARQGVHRVASHLASIGRYGNCAHLVGQYGGAGELAQGYARSAAVKGTTFMLGASIESLQRVERLEPQAKPDVPGPDSSCATTKPAIAWQVQISSIEGPVTANWIVGHPTLFSDSPQSANLKALQGRVARGFLLFDRPVDYAGILASGAAGNPPGTDQDEEASTKSYETALIVFPPHETRQSSCQVLSMGEGTFSCPKGTYLYYLSMHMTDEEASKYTSEQVLKPYVQQLSHWAARSEPEWKHPTPTPSSCPSDPEAQSVQTETRSPSGEEQRPRFVPLMECFYWQPSKPENIHMESLPGRAVPITFPPASILHDTPALPPTLAELSDRASEMAEEAFWYILGSEELASLPSKPSPSPAQSREAGHELKTRAQHKAQRRSKRWEGRDATEYAGRAGVLEGPSDESCLPGDTNWDEIAEFFPPPRQQED